MFCINVALGSTSWRLLFKDEDKAKRCFETIEQRKGIDVQVEDDFGQVLSATVASIHGTMFEDLDQTKEAHIQMALHQARTQNQAQKMAANDPALRAGMPAPGPAIISPMGNGSRPY